MFLRGSLACVATSAATTAAMLGTSLARPVPTPPPVITVEGHALVRRSAQGGSPTTLIKLPASLNAVTRIDSSSAADVLMLVTRDSVAHVSLRGAKPKLTVVTCTGAATLSADGACIACARGKAGVDVFRFAGKTRQRHLAITAHRVAFRGPGGRELISTTSAAMWIGSGAKRIAKLAHHSPTHAWLLAPSGQRVAGMYAEPKASAKPSTPKPDGATALYAFQLTGKAVKRRLIASATPVAWSRDSQWLLVQTPTAACIVRAVGGQYKCWNEFRAIAITADGGFALLSRAADGANVPSLFVGELAGSRPSPPKQIVSGFAGAATWAPPRAPTARNR